MPQRLTKDFFQRDVLEVAPDLLGKIIVRQYSKGDIKRFTISEVEAYRGEEDLACHASKGRTMRTEVMYFDGGFVYVYLIYGMYYMLNFVCSVKDNPQAILIRGVDKVIGPGRVGKLLEIEESFNKQNLFESSQLWIENGEGIAEYTSNFRIGINYAGEYWSSRPWRFIKK